MRRRAREEGPYEPPELSSAEGQTWNRLRTDHNETFRSLQTINFGQKGGLISLGEDPWPSQQSLDRHIRQVMALNLLRCCKDFKLKTNKPRAWEIIGLWDNYHIPNFEKGMEKLVNSGKNLRALAEELQKRFPDEVVTVDPVKIICGKARRQGCTTWLLGYDFHLTFFTGHTEVAIVAMDEKSVKNIFSYLKRYYAYWPAELAELKPSEISNSKTLLEFANGSKCATYTAGGEEIRSFQLDVVHLSEYAHYDDLSAVTSMLTAIPPHCWVFKESTANGRQGPFYEDWLRARTPIEVAAALDREDADFFAEWNGLYKWFFSWLDDPRYVMKVPAWRKDQILSTLDPYEKALMQRFPDKFTIERVLWRRNKINSGECEDKDLPPEQFFAQEYPADEDEMFQTSGTMPFSSELLDPMDQRAKATKPIIGLWLEPDSMPVNKALQQANCIVWEAPQPEAQYVIGCDVAQGVGSRGDASYISIFKRLDGVSRRQVACYWSKDIDAKALGFILNILARWYNNAFVNVETGAGPGQLTADALYKECGYTNVYAQDTMHRVAANSANSFYIGFNTQGHNKGGLIDEFRFDFKRGLIDILDPRALAEMRVFARNDRGQYGAPNDGTSKDDRVISIALANFADNPMRGAPAFGKKSKPKKVVREIEAANPHGQKDPYTREYLAAVARMRKRATADALAKEKGKLKKAWWDV